MKHFTKQRKMHDKPKCNKLGRCKKNEARQEKTEDRWKKNSSIITHTETQIKKKEEPTKNIQERRHEKEGGRQTKEARQAQ